MGVCSISLHMFSNSWCSFGGGVNDEGIFTREKQGFRQKQGFRKNNFYKDI